MRSLSYLKCDWVPGFLSPPTDGSPLWGNLWRHSVENTNNTGTGVLKKARSRKGDWKSYVPDPNPEWGVRKRNWTAIELWHPLPCWSYVHTILEENLMPWWREFVLQWKPGCLNKFLTFYPPHRERENSNQGICRLGHQTNWKPEPSGALGKHQKAQDENKSKILIRDLN